MWASKRKRFSRSWNLNRGGRAIPRLRLYHCQPSCIGRTQFRPGTNRKTWLLHLFTARIRAALEKSMVPCTIKGYLYTESALLPGFLSVMVSFESSRWPFLTESLLTWGFRRRISSSGSDPSSDSCYTSKIKHTSKSTSVTHNRTSGAVLNSEPLSVPLPTSGSSLSLGATSRGGAKVSSSSKVRCVASR